MRGLETALLRILAGMLGCTWFVTPAWSHGIDGSYRDRLEQAIEPGDVYELCQVITPEQQLHYAFTATDKLGFNIHYHANHEVVYPVPEQRTAAAGATFAAESEQEYCLMWTNPTSGEVMLSVDYEKTPAVTGH